MTAHLDAIVASQGGVFKRGQAFACGFTRSSFRAMIRPGGPWIRVRYGVYTARENWASLDARGRRNLISQATMLVCDEHTTLTHSSAADWLGLPVHDVADGLTHVTRDGPTQTSRIEARVKHHIADLPIDLVTDVRGVNVTNCARTVFDVSREFGYVPGLVTADAALHQGMPLAEFLDLVANLHCQPRGPAIAMVARDARPGADSPHETLSRILLIKMGIADLELQRPIPLPDGRTVFGDIFSHSLNHLFECDGKVKYREGQLDRFGNERSSQDILFDEKQREDLVRGTGIGVSRIIPADTRPERFRAASERLWSEIRMQRR